jgi:hypothetical protein
MAADQIQFDLDDDLAALLAEEGRPLAEVVRERLVFDLYRRGVISSGKGAALLGVGLADFARMAFDLGVD